MLASLVLNREARESRAKFERDLRYGWDMWTWVGMQAKTGRAKVFFYYFAHLPPYPQGSSFAGGGPGHWAELPYVFDHLSQEPWAWTDADRALAKVMATYWTNFAKNGDPNGAGVPLWPNFTNDKQRVLHFAERETVGGVPNLGGELGMPTNRKEQADVVRSIDCRSRHGSKRGQAPLPERPEGCCAQRCLTPF